MIPYEIYELFNSQIEQIETGRQFFYQILFEHV